jgi:hypothetical protein
MIPFWVSEEFGNSLWDELFLGSDTWPGVWKVSPKKDRALEQAKQKGVDGVTITDNGFNAGTVQLVGVIWNLGQWEDLQALIPIYDPQKPGGSSSPLSVYHPALALLGIDTVYLKGIGLSPPNAGGSLTVTLDILQWFPKTKAATPSKKAKGFNGAQNANAALNAGDFAVSPGANTGSNL